MAEQVELEFPVAEMDTEVLCALLAPAQGPCRLHIEQIIKIEEELYRRGAPNG